MGILLHLGYVHLVQNNRCWRRDLDDNIVHNEIFIDENLSNNVMDRLYLDQIADREQGTKN